MSLIKRRQAPDDGEVEALGNRVLQALYEENYSVWPNRRTAAVTDRAEWAEELREDETGALRNPDPIELYRADVDLYRWEEIVES